jgi:hypothetical protein
MRRSKPKWVVRRGRRWLWCCLYTREGFHVFSWTRQPTEAFVFEQETIADAFATMYEGKVEVFAESLTPKARAKKVKQ